MIILFLTLFLLSKRANSGQMFESIFIIFFIIRHYMDNQYTSTPLPPPSDHKYKHFKLFDIKFTWQKCISPFEWRPIPDCVRLFVVFVATASSCSATTCPNGWVRYQTSCYLVVTYELETWSGAQVLKFIYIWRNGSVHFLQLC